MAPKKTPVGSPPNYNPLADVSDEDLAAEQKRRSEAVMTRRKEARAQYVQYLWDNRGVLTPLIEKVEHSGCNTDDGDECVRCWWKEFIEHGCDHTWGDLGRSVPMLHTHTFPTYNIK